MEKYENSEPHLFYAPLQCPHGASDPLHDLVQGVARLPLSVLVAVGAAWCAAGAGVAVTFTVTHGPRASVRDNVNRSNGKGARVRPSHS